MNSELVIEATMENLGMVLGFINPFIENCSVLEQANIGIAVDEIFSNIVRYAYNPDVGGVKVRITAGDGIIIEFEDSGVAYNPLAVEAPDITLQAAEREPGGLGIFIVRNIMDSVEYRREGGKNILTIKKAVE